MIPLLDRLSAAAAAKALQSCPTQCDPIDGGPPGSPVPGILQVLILAPQKELPRLEMELRYGT